MNVKCETLAETQNSRYMVSINFEISRKNYYRLKKYREVKLIINTIIDFILIPIIFSCVTDFQG